MIVMITVAYTPLRTEPTRRLKQRHLLSRAMTAVAASLYTIANYNKVRKNKMPLVLTSVLFPVRLLPHRFHIRFLWLFHFSLSFM